MQFRHIRLQQAAMSWPWFLAVSGAGLTMLFTFLNPESSRMLEPVARFFYWMAHVGLPLALLQLVQLGVSRLRLTHRLAPWKQIALAGGVGAALFAPMAVGLDWAFGLEDSPGEMRQSLNALVIDEVFALAPPIMLVWLGLNAARTLRLPQLLQVEQEPAAAQDLEVSTGSEPSRGEGSERAPHGAADTDMDLPFLAQLAPALGRDLVMLSAELHYLRVKTSRGEALILYSFGQAVAELAASDKGLQVHRSHWVASAHVAGVRRQEGRMFCVLLSGATVPVARSRQAEVAAKFPKA
jgi:hypothetical protein